MKKKVLFLGQAPGASWGEGSAPLGGRNAERLGDLMGMTGEEFLNAFETANVLDEFPGKDGRGDRFPIAAAREAAARMRFDGFDAVVMLGRGVQAALGHRGLEWFEQAERDGTTFIPCPHPSGLNRWWNDQKNIALARERLSQLAPSSR